MASQITHILYADKYLLHYPRPKSKEDFICGVVFPDIRRISNLTRQQTHRHFEELDLDFTGLSSFEAGWKFHVWCDLRRNELLRDQKFMDFPEVQKAHYLSYYFLEDQLLWEQYNNWETVSSILKDHAYIPYFPELGKADWEYWYKIVRQYLKQAPTEETIRHFCKQQPSLATKADQIIDGIKDLRKNKNVVEILSGLHEQLLDIPAAEITSAA